MPGCRSRRTRIIHWALVIPCARARASARVRMNRARSERMTMGSRSRFFITLENISCVMIYARGNFRRLAVPAKLATVAVRSHPSAQTGLALEEMAETHRDWPGSAAGRRGFAVVRLHQLVPTLGCKL